MRFDVVILGAGGAGMMCALHAGARGRRVALIDQAKKPGGKIIISGGGRCNFTNVGASPKQYVSENEHFAKSALSRYLPENFISLVQKHGIAYHERPLGKLFLNDSAQQIIDMLKKECDEVGAEFLLGRAIEGVEKNVETGLFHVTTSQGVVEAESVVVATGGLSIPKMGATGVGYSIAKKFGVAVTATAPALDGFVFAEAEKKIMREMAGISFDSIMSCNKASFHEHILFTHHGLSGPASLQASLHWREGDSVTLNFIPTLSREALLEWFAERKNTKQEIKNLLGELIPKRLAENFAEAYLPPKVSLANLPKKTLEAFCEKLQAWTFIPAGTVGYNKAEVTRGGVDTRELSSKTMESRKVPGLYFIGEVVDVTGWLGGYNFQWAWASGWAAAQVV